MADPDPLEPYPGNHEPVGASGKPDSRRGTGADFADRDIAGVSRARAIRVGFDHATEAARDTAHRNRRDITGDPGTAFDCSTSGYPPTRTGTGTNRGQG